MESTEQRVITLSDGVDYFSFVPKEALIHFSTVIDIHTTTRLSSTCKRLRAILAMNLVWQNKASRYIPEYLQIHPLDFKVKQPEGFWFNWFKKRMPTPIKLCSPRKVKVDLYDNDGTVNGFRYRYEPNKGSFMIKNQKDPQGVIYTAYFIVTHVETYKRKGGIKEIRVAPCIETIKNMKIIGKTFYRKVDARLVKFNSEFETYQSGYNVLTPESVIY